MKIILKILKSQQSFGASIGLTIAGVSTGIIGGGLSTGFVLKDFNVMSNV